jgi:hypothetical protein
MGFPRRPLRAPAPVRIPVSVFAIGRRVYVACAGGRSARVTLTDEADRRPLASLGDGTEVACCPGVAACFSVGGDHGHSDGLHRRTSGESLHPVWGIRMRPRLPELRDIRQKAGSAG